MTIVITYLIGLSSLMMKISLFLSFLWVAYGLYIHYRTGGGVTNLYGAFHIIDMGVFLVAMYFFVTRRTQDQ